MYEFDVLAAGEREEIPPHGGLDAGGAIRSAFEALVIEIPRSPALTLAPETAVATAVEAMRARRRGVAIVLQNQRPVGLLTDRDILSRDGVLYGELRSVPVGSLMSACPEPIRLRDTVATALKKMGARRHGQVPIVCDEGLFLGALDVGDICLWLSDSLTEVSVEACFAGRA